MKRREKVPVLYCFEIDGINYSTWTSNDLEVAQRRLFYGNFREILKAREHDGTLGPHVPPQIKRAPKSKKKPGRARQSRSIQHIVEQWPNKAPPPKRAPDLRYRPNPRKAHVPKAKRKPPRDEAKSKTSMTRETIFRRANGAKVQFKSNSKRWAYPPGYNISHIYHTRNTEGGQNKKTLYKTSSDIWKLEPSNSGEFDFLSHSPAPSTTVRPMSAIGANPRIRVAESGTHKRYASTDEIMTYSRRAVYSK